jgi:hypothetical protein
VEAGVKPGPVELAVERAADEALTTGEIVTLPELGLVVVPDTVIVEAVANGHDVTSTVRLYRADGRVAYVWKLP